MEKVIYCKYCKYFIPPNDKDCIWGDCTNPFWQDAEGWDKSVEEIDYCSRAELNE